MSKTKKQKWKQQKDPITLRFYDKWYYSVYCISGTNYSPDLRAMVFLSLAQTMILSHLAMVLFIVQKKSNPSFHLDIHQRAIISFSLIGIFLVITIINAVIFFNRSNAVISQIRANEKLHKSLAIYGIIFIGYVLLFFVSFVSFGDYVKR